MYINYSEFGSVWRGLVSIYKGRLLNSTMTTTKSVDTTTKKNGVAHNENGIICQFDKNHYNKKLSTDTLYRQQNYRASALVEICVPFMSKCQAIGEFSQITNPTEMVLALALKSVKNLTMDDLDRENLSHFGQTAPQTAITPQTEQVVPQTAIAIDNSVAIVDAVITYIKANFNKETFGFDKLRNALKTECGYDDKFIDAHFNTAYPLPQTPQ